MPSKLGPHFIGTPGFERWLAAGPRVMKFDPTSLGASAQVPPGILVVGKLDQEDEQLRLTDWKALMNRGASPADAARDRFEAQRNIFVGANKPRVDRYAVNGRIDVWEDDNEIVPDDPREAQWYAEYCIEMMRRYESIGKKRANFSFATGTPDIRPGHPDDIWPHLLPAVRYARDHGHFLALHEYMGPEAELGVGHTQVDVHRKRIPNAWHGRRDAAGNPDERYPYGYCPLRYRYVYDLYLRPAGLADVPLLITECGCDGVDAVTPDDMEAGSWTHLRDGFWRRAGRDPEPHYAGMLIWYDQRLREDDFVAGAMIFTVGAGKRTKWEEWNIAGTGVEERVLAHIAAARDKPDSLVPAPSAVEPAPPAKLAPPAKPAPEPGLAAAKPAPEPAVSAAQPQEGVVTAPAGLNLRTTPTTAGGDETIIRRLEIGEKVTVIERFSDEWLRVRANGDTGFVFAAFVSLGAPPPPAPAPPAPRSSAGFQPGMNVNIGVHAPDVERLRGLSWVRFVFIAADRKQSVDEAFHSTYSPLIGEYAAAGIRSLIILNHETEHGNVPWINGDWAAYAPHFGHAARRVAELCAPFGDMVAFQIWNEEDSGWSADAGNPNPSARGIRPEDFALVVDAAAANIRAVAPQAKIVAGGLKTGPHNGVAYLRAATARLGRRLPVDAIACHPYGRYVNTDPFYGKRIGPLPEALAAYRNAFPEFPLWITEIGIPGEDNPIGPEHYDNIALYMREFVTEVANRHGNHVPVLIWFAWTDRMNNAGILTADGREKPGIFQAFQAMKARGVGSKVEALESALEGLEAVAGATFGFVAAPAGLNLRARPIDGDVITILLPETRVELLELADGWYRVRAGDLEGYVSAEWITTVPTQSQVAAAPQSRAAAPLRTASVVGIHGAPGGAAPPRHLWDTWTNLLKEMGIRWYKQCETGDDTGDGSIFQWVLHLKRNGIEPIVRYLMNAQFPGNLEERFIRQMARYAGEGVHWAEIGNEPNLAYEWQESWRGRYEGKWPDGRWAEEPRMRWGNAEAIHTLARVWVEDATRAADAGAWPAFYAFGPTDWGKDRPHGHYSSTLFTELVVSRLAGHHRAETIRLFRERRAWIAVHVAKYEKPLDFDPYSDDPHRPWDMSLRGYEVVLNAFRRHFGGDLNVAAIPIISTEGGVFVPDHRNSVGAERLPADDDDHARQTLDMFRFVEEKTPLMAMCPWCIAEGHAIIGHGTDLFRHHGWFKEQNGRLVERPVLAAMRRRRQELEKGIDLAALAAGGLESLAEPAAAADKPALNISLNISVSLHGGEVSDVTVTVNPIAGNRGTVKKTKWIIRKSMDSAAPQEAIDG